MKHVKTIVKGKQDYQNEKDMDFAVSCKMSVTLGTNVNSEHKRK